MKLVDARSGQEFEVARGDTVFDPPLVLDYGDGDSTTIRRISAGLVKASADTTVTMGGKQVFSGWAPLQVRWTHPGFFLQHVAFIPS